MNIILTHIFFPDHCIEVVLIAFSSNQIEHKKGEKKVQEYL